MSRRLRELGQRLRAVGNKALEAEPNEEAGKAEHGFEGGAEFLVTSGDAGGRI